MSCKLTGGYVLLKLLALSALVFTLGLGTTSTARANSLQVSHKPWNRMTIQQKIIILKKQIHKDHCIIRFWKNHTHIKGITWKQTNWAKISLKIATKNLNALQVHIYSGGNSIRNWLLSHGHGCLVQIIDLENRSYDPTLNYGGGHGNTSVAYGIPQAYPGTKMASAGSDWRTNPFTQIRWMIGYVNRKFGSECAAAYARLNAGTY